MGKNSVPLPVGATKETITHERVIPDGEEQNAAGYGMDAYDYMASLSETDWQDHIVYLYRKFPAPANGAKRTYIAKLTHSFDDDWLKTNFGGGQYHFIVKKGSQRIKEGDSDDIPGPPKNPDEVGIHSGNGARPGDTELTRTVELVLTRMGMSPNNGNGELAHKAFVNALEIQKAAIISNQMTPMQMLEMAEKMRGGHTPSETPEWLKQVLTALIPMGVGLIGKMLEPKDMLQTIQAATAAMNALKGAGSEPTAPDYGVELLRNGPQLLRGVVEVMGEARRAAELQAAARQLTAGVTTPSAARPVPPERVVTSAAPANGQPAATPAAGSGSPVDFSNPENFWRKIFEMCKNGDDGKFGFSFFDTIDPQSAKWLHDQNFTLDQFKAFLVSGMFPPIMGDLAALPGYPKFIAEFHAALMGTEVPVAA